MKQLKTADLVFLDEKALSVQERRRHPGVKPEIRRKIGKHFPDFRRVVNFISYVATKKLNFTMREDTIEEADVIYDLAWNFIRV